MWRTTTSAARMGVTDAQPGYPIKSVQELVQTLILTASGDPRGGYRAGRSFGAEFADSPWPRPSSSRGLRFTTASAQMS